MRLDRIIQASAGVLLISFLISPASAQVQDTDQQRIQGRGFDFTDSRIMAHGLDRRDIIHGRGPIVRHHKGREIKLDWNYDVSGPVNSTCAKWNFLYAGTTTGDNTQDRLFVGVNAIAGGASPRTKLFRFHTEVTELGSTAKRMLEAINDLAEVPISMTIIGSGISQVSAYVWVTSRGNPGAVTIPSGSVWQFTISALSSAINSNKLFFRVYKRDATGATTQILESAQTAFLTKSKASYTASGTFSSAVTLTSTDRLEFRVMQQNYVSQNRTVTIYIEGANTATATTTIPGNNVYAFSDIYNTVGSPDQQPFCLWQTAIGNGTGRIDGSSVAFNLDGTRIFLGCTDGKVYCLDASNGSVVWTYDTGSSIVYSTSFFDFGYNLIWIGSTDGRLHKIDANNGLLIQKSTNPISSHPTQYAIHSTPIRYALGGIDVVFVVPDDGHVYRVNPSDVNTLVPDNGVLGSIIYNLTRSLTTTAADAVYATPLFDVDTNTMILAVNGAIYKVNIATGVINTAALWTAGSVIYSSPGIDSANNFVYVGGGTKLWKIDNTLWVSIFQGTTVGTNPDNTYPKSSPLWIQDASGTSDFVFIADGGGYVNRFDSNDLSISPTLLGSFQFQSLAADPLDNDSNTQVIMDFFTGNIYFGAGNHRVYQLTQVF